MEKKIGIFGSRLKRKSILKKIPLKIGGKEDDRG